MIMKTGPSRPCFAKITEEASLFVAFRHLAIRFTQNPQEEIPRMKEPTGFLYYRDRYNVFVYLVILGYWSTKYVTAPYHHMRRALYM